MIRLCGIRERTLSFDVVLSVAAEWKMCVERERERKKEIRFCFAMIKLYMLSTVHMP